MPIFVTEPPVRAQMHGMSQRPHSSNGGSQIFLATEPIVNRQARILGFQIHVGEALSPGAPDQSAASDAARLASSVEPDGVAVLSRGQSAFVQVSRENLLGSDLTVLHPRHTVLELPASVGAGSDVRAKCAELRDRGYRFSIDRFDINAPAAELVPYASYLKLDCGDESRSASRSRAVACFRSEVAAIIGTGVHTPAQLDAAAAEGFQCFQGFALAVPHLSTRREFSPSQVGLLRLLGALGDPNLSIGHLEELVKHDPALCYRILQAVNSAAFALRTTVISMGQAILLLGRDTIRRWASLWTMAGLGADSHDELVVMSAVRARLCETLVSTSRGSEAGSQAFLLGMCSLFDAILGRSMQDIVRELPVGPDAEAVLCGEPGPMRDVLDCVIAHERGDWAVSQRLAIRSKVNPRLLPGAFMEALRWAREINDISARIGHRH